MQARIDYIVEYNVAPLDKEKQANCYLYDPNLNILVAQQNYFVWTMNPFDMPVVQDTVTRFTNNIVGKKVLVVGHGIGMMNSLIRDLEPAEHWIIEANSNQRDRMAVAGFVNEGTTHIISDRWEDSTRVEGFPDDFVIPVADASAYKQFGNSVAVPAIQATAEKIINLLGL